MEAVDCTPERPDPAELRETLGDLVRPVLQFLKAQSCYGFLPHSCQVVVMDVELPVQSAFSVALENKLTSTTLWDNNRQQLVGIVAPLVTAPAATMPGGFTRMLTVTDFIKVLIHFYDNPEKWEEYQGYSIRKWRELLFEMKQVGAAGGTGQDELICVTAEDNLLHCLTLFHKHRVHRIPVVEDGALLYVMTHGGRLSPIFPDPMSPALAFAACSLQSGLLGSSIPISHLNIGTFEKVYTCTADDQLHTLLKEFLSHKISSLPVINENGMLDGLFSRSDLMWMANEGEFDLNLPLSHVMDELPKGKGDVFTFFLDFLAEDKCPLSPEEDFVTPHAGSPPATPTTDPRDGPTSTTQAAVS
eukprot:gene4262-774_t